METEKTFAADIAARSADKLEQHIPEQYESLGRISEGGMGAIYKVRNRYTGACFAIKLLLALNEDDTLEKQRFVVEAKAASTLNHPNVCRVHDFGLSKGLAPYLVMEWIEGISLERKIERDGPLPAGECIRIFSQVCSALKHAHEHKVVHRDLKPDNIMLLRNDSGETEVRLVDFGIAKLLEEGEDFSKTGGLTRTGTVIGSPLYMSPEQARGQEIDGRSDIYSLGCAMYAALSGQPPFVADTFVDTVHMHLKKQPAPFAAERNVPSDLQRIVLKTMEKRREDRYPSMELLAADLDKVARGVGVGRITLTAQRQKLKQRLINVAVFVGSFLAIYLLSLALQDRVDPRPASAPAHSQRK